MIINLHCHVSINISAVDETIETDVPDDFFDWEESKQFEYLADEYNSWMGSNMDSGYDFSRIIPKN